jgi:hypothetical protein
MVIGEEEEFAERARSIRSLTNVNQIHFKNDSRKAMREKR